MTEDEANDAFTSLSNILRSSGLAWIVDQIDEEIQVGRIVNKSSRPDRPQENVLFDLGAPQRPGSAVGTEPYTAHERLGLLISATRLVFSHSAALEAAVSQAFPVVMSVPDLAIAGTQPQQITGHAARDAERRVDPLLDLLERRLHES